MVFAAGGTSRFVAYEPAFDWENEMSLIFGQRVPESIPAISNEDVFDICAHPRPPRQHPPRSRLARAAPVERRLRFPEGERPMRSTDDSSDRTPVGGGEPREISRVLPVLRDHDVRADAHLYNALMKANVAADDPGAVLRVFRQVSVTGTFLVNKEHVESHRWSCMFGDVEVPAEVLTDGTLRCYALAHQSGRVPFYVTCSNMVACSEVREFEYRDSEAHYMETSRSQANGVNEMHLHIRLEKLLTLGPDDHQMLAINSLMLDGKWSNQESSVKEVVSTARVQSLKKLVKEKLHQWLICKVNDDGKGPNVLCKEGQGVIHFVAALGYDWAIRPIIIAGVNVNFRDAHGWTALHWAASLGRERTVSVLIANGHKIPMRQWRTATGAQRHRASCEPMDDDKYEFTDPARIESLVKNCSQFVSFPIYTWKEKSRTFGDEVAKSKQSTVSTKTKKFKEIQFQKLQRLPDGCHPDFDNDHLCSVNNHDLLPEMSTPSADLHLLPETVVREPRSILHAFNIALCWRAASFLKYTELDRRESLALASDGLNYECNEAPS
ncbi:Calmodulin-binding transcription activator 1 [Zea mays]|uniref:Calmodulin-binding transcription activator 1 n=1 Tax=Zea mays TaxID=4577 RepID=A0A3L6FI43_MAIZE|nr:Calmodulin-binding transcription activator 1 [Zea mays]